MSWTATSGTQAADGSEDTLTTLTANGTFALKVDTHNMQAGDVVELRIYTKVLSGSTSRQAWKGVIDYLLSQINPVSQSPFLPSDIECHFTLKQVAGINRSYDWSVLQQ